jgi:rod shape-determining protein MreC
MSDFLRRIRLPLIFAALVLLTTFFMIGDQRTPRGGARDAPWPLSALLEAAVPVQRALRWPAERTREVWSRYLALVAVGEENDALRSQLASLEEENLQLREALVASGNLERIVAMRRGFDIPLMPGEVIGQDVSQWFRSLLIDRGRDEGVASGMPVISDQGLVGLVTATSSSGARTMLLVDRRAAVDAVVERSRALGIVRGTGGAALELTFMQRGDDVREGDLLVTSGIGGVYPKGLRIGTVRSVRKEPRALVHTARVEPAVDFGRVEQVFVMLRRGPTMDLLYSGDGDAPDVPDAPKKLANTP